MARSVRIGRMCRLYKLMGHSSGARAPSAGGRTDSSWRRSLCQSIDEHLHDRFLHRARVDRLRRGVPMSVDGPEHERLHDESRGYGWIGNSTESPEPDTALEVRR